MRHYREYGDTDNWRGLPERHFLLIVLLLFESNSHSLGTMLDKKFRHVPPCCPERRMIFQFIPLYVIKSFLFYTARPLSLPHFLKIIRGVKLEKIKKPPLDPYLLGVSCIYLREIDFWIDRRTDRDILQALHDFGCHDIKGFS